MPFYSCPPLLKGLFSIALCRFSLHSSGTENPRVGGSIPSLATIHFYRIKGLQSTLHPLFSARKSLRDFCVIQDTAILRRTTSSGLLLSLLQTRSADSISLGNSATE
jgi:hypothetical protein